MAKLNFVALDFETTGLKPQNSRVIEVGLAKIENGEITETFATLINPGVPLPYSITMLTGITQDDLEFAPTFEEVAHQIIQFIGEAPIVAHNAPFDFSFLQNELKLSGFESPENKALCTAKIARRLFPEMPKKSLAALSRKFAIRNKNTHRALSDAVTAAKVFLKMLPYLEENFGITTLGQLLKFQTMQKKSANVKFIKKTLLNDLANVPDAPGVYLYKNSKGDVIYVGKAKSLKKRLGSYFLATANRKAKQIVKKAKNIEFIETNTELTALLAETKLVKKYDPEFNSQLKKFPQTHFIKIDLEKKYPRPKSVAQLKPDAADYFGPYRNRETANDILEIVNKAFELRECTEKEFERKKICYLAEINRCLAPCVNEIEKDYKNELEKVYDFLMGENQNALNVLLEKMKFYSEKLQFEQAAEIRDAVQRLLNQLKRTSILAEPVNRANALVEIKGGKNNDYILLLAGEFYIKNDVTEPRDFFDEALTDYFSNTVKFAKTITPEAIEYFKIALAWLNAHRNAINVYYLKNYNSKEELYKAMQNKIG